MAFAYFDVTHAIEVHDEIINVSGGVLGIINEDLLHSVLGHIQNDDYYPTLESKITHLLYSINKNHSFQDGNKRSSIALSAYFLEINGCDFIVGKFIQEMENFSVDVAENRIEKDLLLQIISSIIYEDDFDLGLKFKIMRAKMGLPYEF